MKHGKHLKLYKVVHSISYGHSHNYAPICGALAQGACVSQVPVKQISWQTGIAVKLVIVDVFSSLMKSIEKDYASSLSEVVKSLKCYCLK